MNADRVPFQRIVFVCINQRPEGEGCCAERGSEEIAAQIKARIKALGLSGKVRVSKSGCQDLCARGPNVMVFPEYVWYHAVTHADIDRIVQDVARGLDAPGATPAGVPPTARPGH